MPSTQRVRVLTVFVLAALVAGSSILAMVPYARAGTAVVFEETFEDGTLSPSWAVNDTEPLSGRDYWGVSNVLNHTGRYSAWCAQVGNQSVGPNQGLNNSDVGEYDDNMQADLVIDLRVDGYTSLNLSFYYWAKTESGGGDWIQAWYEAGGVQTVIFNPRGSTGNNWDFASVSVPNNVEKLIIRFHSDGGNHGFEGAFIDDIKLEGVEFVPPTSSVTTMPAFSNGLPYQVPFAAQDNANASGIAYLELWYRNSTTGTWKLYTSPLNTSGQWTTTSIPFEVTHADGDGYYEFYTIAVDRAGNAEAAPAGPDGSITIDTALPTLQIVAPPDGSEVGSGDVTVEWSGTDSLSGLDHFEVSLDGADFDSTGLTFNKAFTGLAPGQHTATIRAYDRAGNVREVSTTFAVPSTPVTEFPWLILLIVLLVIVGGILAFFYWTRKKEEDEAGKALESRPEEPGSPP